MDPRDMISSDIKLTLTTILILEMILSCFSDTE